MTNLLTEQDWLLLSLFAHTIFQVYRIEISNSYLRRTACTAISSRLTFQRFLMPQKMYLLCAQRSYRSICHSGHMSIAKDRIFLQLQRRLISLRGCEGWSVFLVLFFFNTGIVYTLRFRPFLDKGDDFVFCLSCKWICSKRKKKKKKRNANYGSNFFSFIVDPFSERNQNNVPSSLP